MKWTKATLLAAVCALAQVKLLRMASSNLDTALTYVMRAVWAQTEWAGYRSRLLAPTLIHFLGGDMRAFLAITFISLVIGGLLSWRLAGPAGLGIYHAAFAFVANPWFAPWDIFGPVLFTLFVLFVVERRPALWFIVLFAVAIFDRQSAMFIALWMVISRKMIVPGLVCAAAGIFVMWFFQHSGAPKLGLFAFASGYGNDYAQERILENLHNIIDWLVAGILVVIVGAAVTVMRRGYTALGLTFLALLATTVLLGIVTETRVYLDFIPILVLAGGGADADALAVTHSSITPASC